MSLYAQDGLHVYAAKEGDLTVLYAENREVCAVSVKLSLTLDNLSVLEPGDGIYTVPANTDHYRLAALEKIREHGKSSYSYNYSAVYGDVRQTTYDHDYIYDLPFRSGLQARVDQGYNGTFSHQGENALDFNMKEGTEVCAARAGLVIAVVQHFNENCWRDECKKMANYVLIQHSDGTIAEYNHLLFNGAKVRVGDMVEKGELIALSGNTGYTRGPHLHFDCYLPGFDARRTLITKFRTGKGNNTAYLAENKTYKKNYS